MKNELRMQRNEAWPVWAGMGLGRLERELGRFFDFPGSLEAPWPALNIREDEAGITVEAELPGFAADQIEVQVENGQLVLSGTRVEETRDEGAETLLQERRSGAFKRVVNLPWKVATENIAARYREGILTVTLPRAEEDKPRKIEVSTNG